jgi:hypothetical protein
MVTDMKTKMVLTFSAITLFLILITGPTTAGVFDQLDGLIQEKYHSRESVKLSGYMNSSGYSLLEPQFAKPELNAITDFGTNQKSDLIKIDLVEKDLWKSLPTSGPYCPTCGFKNATKSFGSIFTEDYSAPVSGFFFGGSGGGAGPAGGGCCG